MIPFINLKKQYQTYKAEIDAAISKTVENTAFILGPEVSGLEKELAEFTQAKSVVACSSGTDALLIALLAAGVKAGDEVITTPFTFFATVEMILLLGAKPVFVDIDEKTFNINPDLIEEKITDKTKVIVPVSLYGQMADLSCINQIAEKHNIKVLEDAAQSFGASNAKGRSCSQSTMAATSFFPAKPMGCFGDGGAVFINDDKYSELARQIMNHGQTGRYEHEVLGINGRLDALQAAILRVKLKHYQYEINQRNERAERYKSEIKNQDVILPFVSEGETSVWAQFTLKSERREEIVSFLQERGVPTAVHYPEVAYKQGLMKDQYSEELCPIAERICKEVFSIPICAFLSEEDQSTIIQAINQFS